jgi:hypothetical protein
MHRRLGDYPPAAAWTEGERRGGRGGYDLSASLAGSAAATHRQHGLGLQEMHRRLGDGRSVGLAF